MYIFGIYTCIICNIWKLLIMLVENNNVLNCLEHQDGKGGVPIMNHTDLFLGHEASQGKILAIMNVCVGDYKY